MEKLILINQNESIIKITKKKFLSNKMIILIKNILLLLFIISSFCFNVNNNRKNPLIKNYSLKYTNYKKIVKLIKTINKYILKCKNGILIHGIKKSSKIPKITVTIILYNSNETIKTTVRSIQNQIFADIEILIIDDCSNDNNSIILDYLRKEDKRIKLLKNKKNRGALYSRSIGALKSRGKYIFPIDSDDLFANENIISLCYNEAEKDNIDIIEFSGFSVKNGLIPNNKKLPKIPYYLKNKKDNLVIRAPKLGHFIYKRNKNGRLKLIDGYIWGKCIKSIIYKKTLKVMGDKIYTQNICFGEDRIVNFILFKVAKSFKFIKEYGIIYNYNPNSIIHSKNIIKNCHDELFNIMNIFHFTKNTQEVEIAIFEIKKRWKSIIYPGLNLINKKYLIHLLNLMINCKYVKLYDKIILKTIIKKLNNKRLKII